MKILTEYIPSITFMAGIYSIAVAILFFTYGKKIENDVVQDNVKLLLDNLTDDVFDLLSPEQKTAVKSHISGLTVHQSIKNSDIQVKTRNKRIMDKAIKYISIFAVTAVTVSVLLWYFGKLPYKEYGIEVVIKSFFFLTIIVIVEMIFFTLITKHYRSLDPSVVKYNIIKKLQELYPPSPKS